MSDHSPRLISIDQVCAMTSLSRTAINNYRKAGSFPRDVCLGRRITFVASEVEQWIADRIEAARDGADVAA